MRAGLTEDKLKLGTKVKIFGRLFKRSRSQFWMLAEELTVDGLTYKLR